MSKEKEFNEYIARVSYRVSKDIALWRIVDHYWGERLNYYRLRDVRGGYKLAGCWRKNADIITKAEQDKKKLYELPIPNEHIKIDYILGIFECSIDELEGVIAAFHENIEMFLHKNNIIPVEDD